MSIGIVTSINGTITVDPGDSYRSQKVECVKVVLSTTDRPQTKEDGFQVGIRLQSSNDEGALVVVSFKDLQNAIYALQRASKDEECF